MGRAKAWLPWFGRTLVEHVVERLRPAVDELIVVRSERLDLPPLDARVVTDREPERGPLAGIRDGLAAARSEWAFVTATDTPFLTPAHVEALFARRRAAAPVAEGRIQVLSAVYPCTAWREAGALLERGVSRPLALLEALDYEPVFVGPDPGLGAAPPWRGFNTPAEYLVAAREVDPEAQAELELLGRAARAAGWSCRCLPIGTLASLLAAAPARVGLLDAGGERVAPPFLVSLGGRDIVRHGALPVGPGERASVIDAQMGG